MEKMYQNLEYVNKLLDIQRNYKTYYAWGAIGSPANKKNRERYKVPNAPSDSFLFDCSGFAYKALPLGWIGDKNRTYGGADPGKDMDLFNCNDILSICDDVSSDFSRIQPGEVLYMSGHVGIYIGEGRAVECTSNWSNGVLISLVSNITTESGEQKRKWLKHGKLPFVIYNKEEIAEPVYTTARIGEGLIRIARRVGISFDEIKRLNPEIKGPVYLVRLGQKVRIK